MLRVNNNISAINAQRSIGRHNTGMQRQLERLSSGLRVNRAADDASGLVVSEGMRGELSGLRQNVRNAEQASNLLQVAEGSLQVVNKPSRAHARTVGAVLKQYDQRREQGVTLGGVQSAGVGNRPDCPGDHL